MFVDSHCHLNFLKDPQAALQRARESHVNECLCIGVEQSSIQAVLAYAEADSAIWATVGEHPGNAGHDCAWMKQYLSHPKVVALGEMGLDYHLCKDEAARQTQRRCFVQQLELAEEFHFPVVVHSREAEQETLSLLSKYPAVVGVLHCFTESWAMAEVAIEMGFYISISGIVTFNNADNVREVASRVPDSRLLIETDAPWLAPVPYRGKENQPAYVVATAQCIADLRKVPLRTLAEQTRNNFFELFSRALS
ncbi:MAG: TatD family hydrolase [Gammaproteobacteria bacterium]|nr:TatD family hydrolase [Gammaproteobacteria bacterium]